MKIRRHEMTQDVDFEAESFDMVTSEPVMLIHLLQKLVFARRMALAFTDAELRVLNQVIRGRLLVLSSGGEDQFRDEREGRKMRQPSKHYSQRHPAVGAVTCPFCHSARGTPCRGPAARAGFTSQYCGTHVARAKLYERTDAGEGRAGSQEPGE